MLQALHVHVHVHVQVCIYYTVLNKKELKMQIEIALVTIRYPHVNFFRF